jgi:hypothetical protein
MQEVHGLLQPSLALVSIIVPTGGAIARPRIREITFDASRRERNHSASRIDPAMRLPMVSPVTTMNLCMELGVLNNREAAKLAPTDKKKMARFKLADADVPDAGRRNGLLRIRVVHGYVNEFTRSRREQMVARCAAAFGGTAATGGSYRYETSKGFGKRSFKE